MAEAVKGFGETLAQLIDKLAGKGSDVKLRSIEPNSLTTFLIARLKHGKGFAIASRA